MTAPQKNSPQVDRSHYEFSRYGFEGRFVSYYWQLETVLRRRPDSVLEVGVGDRVFGDFIKNNTPVSYHCVDIAQDLKPDTVASVTSLPFADNSFDVVCAFEVLEHLPFEEVERAVAQLSRVAKKYVVVSVPHFGPMLSFSLKIPLIPTLRFALKIPFPKTHRFNGQHYWELGKRGYPVARLRRHLQKYGTIVSDFVPFNSAYHHFFVIRL